MHNVDLTKVANPGVASRKLRAEYNARMCTALRRFPGLHDKTDNELLEFWTVMAERQAVAITVSQMPEDQRQAIEIAVLEAENRRYERHSAQDTQTAS